MALAIFQTGAYRVKASSVGQVKQAIVEFVEHVKANELGTQMYLAWQQKDDPTLLTLPHRGGMDCRKP